MNASDDNIRISKHLGLSKKILQLIQASSNGFLLSKLDYKIHNTNSLNHDLNKSPMERVNIALTKFGRMSSSEIVTPAKVADQMVALLPESLSNSDGLVLDIASKQAEFTVALMRRYGDQIGQRTYAICTSMLAYEFTRKVYSLLSLPTDHIFNSFTSYDLIKSDNQKLTTLLKDMNFTAIIGNPPYQDMGGSGGTNDAPIYQEFCMFASGIKPNYITLVIPSRWFAAGRENLLGNFRSMMLNSRRISKLTSFNNSRELFSNVEIKGGICYYLEESSYDGDCFYTLNNGQSVQSDTLALNTFEVLIREPQVAKIVAKILSATRDSPKVDSIISADTPFGIPTNPTDNKKNIIEIVDQKDDQHPIQLHYLTRLKRSIGYISKDVVSKNTEDISKYKVYVPGAGGSGNDSKILGDPIVAMPGSICSQTYLYSAFESYDEANAFALYLRTKFLRFLVASIKITQHALSGVYRYVPMQDFTANSDIDWSRSVAEIDQQLYEKYHLNDKEIQFIESMIQPM
jgi:hypothetical protein